jgi:acetyl/propionyl-CoA carboxylase alpha subunit
MISKLVAHGKTREIAISKMSEALENYVISGLKTNIEFLHSLLDSVGFTTGKYDTQYVEKVFIPEIYEKGNSPDKETERAIALGACLFKAREENTSRGQSKIQNNGVSKWGKMKYDTYR